MKSNKAIMKTRSHTIRTALWVLLGIAILLSSLALTRPLPLVQEATATPTLPTTTTMIATAEARDEVGSTDGIMLMAAVIVLIVIIPILLRQKARSDGNKKK